MKDHLFWSSHRSLSSSCETTHPCLPWGSAFRSALGSFHGRIIILNVNKITSIKINSLISHICFFLFLHCGCQALSGHFNGWGKNSTHSGNGQSLLLLPGWLSISLFLPFCFLPWICRRFPGDPIVGSLMSESRAAVCRSSEVKPIMNHPWRSAPSSRPDLFSLLSPTF